MVTNSGKQVFPSYHHSDYTGESPTVADIAQGLGRMVRFAGQTRSFWTVLCHVLVGTELVPDEYKIHFLLHDAPECIVSDVVTTWKSGEAKMNEDSLLHLICNDLGVAYPWTRECKEAVLAADLACLAAEAHALGHAQAERWWPKESFGELEAKAFDMTIEMLQQGAPFFFIDPLNSVPAYQHAVKLALPPKSTPGLKGAFI